MKNRIEVLEGRIHKCPKSTYGGYYSKFYIALRGPGLSAGQRVMMKIQDTEFPTKLITNGKQTCAPMPRGLVHHLRPFDGKKVRVEILERPRKNQPFAAICKKGTNYFLNLKIAIPKQSYNGYKISILELPDDLLRVSYQTITRTPKPVDIPQYLSLNNKNFEVMGLAQGELFKCVRKGLLSFSNSNPALVNRFLNFCERAFRLKRIEWKASLVISRLNCSEELEKELKKFWSKNVGIPFKNFVKTHFHPYGQKHPMVHYTYISQIFYSLG